MLAELQSAPTGKAGGPTVPGEHAPPTCNPPCTRGELCSPAGQCVSACNPRCPPGQACTDAGQCVPSASSTMSAPPPVPTTAYPSAGVYPGAPPTTAYPSAGVYPGAPPATTYPSAGVYPGAPPTAMSAPPDDPKTRRMNARPAWSLYVGIGGGEYDGHEVQTGSASSTGTITSYTRLKHEGLVLDAGFGFRKYLTRIMGVQARGSLLLGFGKGTLVGGFADATLRLGPFGRGFPIFFGLGPALGPAFLNHSGHSGAAAFGGGVAEVGFLFGATDRIEIVLRTYAGAGTIRRSRRRSPRLLPNSLRGLPPLSPAPRELF